MELDLQAYKKEWFEFSNYKPHRGQEMLHSAPSDKRFIVACCGIMLLQGRLKSY